MKIILTGCTGYIGTEVLEQCLKHTFISHVHALTRKPLDRKYATHKKVTQVIHENFDEWPDRLTQKLKGYGVQGCIWCLGGKVQRFRDLEEAQKVGISYPIQAAEALAKHIAPEMMESQTGQYIQPFRFVFMSGWGAEQNQFRTLWMWSDSRKIKGAAEKGLFEIAEHSQEVDGKKSFHVIALRAGTVIAGGDAMTTIVAMGTMPCVAVDRLAKTAIRMVLDGHTEGKTILENADCLGDDWAQVNSLVI